MLLQIYDLVLWKPLKVGISVIFRHLKTSIASIFNEDQDYNAEVFFKTRLPCMHKNPELRQLFSLIKNRFILLRKWSGILDKDERVIDYSDEQGRRAFCLGSVKQQHFVHFFGQQPYNFWIEPLDTSCIATVYRLHRKPSHRLWKKYWEILVFYQEFGLF